MQNRILTTHVGSLNRPPEVLDILNAIERGEEIDEAARERTLTHAVNTIVQQQADAGIDIVSDGEIGKINWISYLYERLTGLEVHERAPRDDRTDEGPFVNEITLMRPPRPSAQRVLPTARRATFA